VIVAVHSKITPVVFLGVENVLDLKKIAMSWSSWQMQNKFVPDFACQNHIFPPRMVNFMCNIPIHRGIQYNLPQGSIISSTTICT
jgi:hypothetical protein